MASPQRASWLALALILLLGAVFRFTGLNWDELQHLHPDERFLTMVTTGIELPGGTGISGALPQGCRSWGGYFDTKCSPLNPYNRGFGNFVYGTFPLFLVKLVGEVVGKGGYDQVHLVGRALSGLFDLFSVALIFFIGRRLYGRRVGLLAALLLAASVLNIQQSHFFTVDTFANVPLLLAFWFALDVAAGRGGWRSFLLTGVCFGLALAARINLAPFAAIIALAGLLRLMQGAKITAVGLARETAAPAMDAAAGIHTARRTLRIGPFFIEIETRRRTDAQPTAAAAPAPPGWLHLAALTALGLIGAAAAALLTFRIAQPYAFLGLGLNPQFSRDMEFARTLIGGQLDMPPMHQWTARPDYWFPFINMVLWGLGPALGIAGWLGFILTGFEIAVARRWRHLLGFFWVGGLFLYLGQQVAKTDRYYLPLYPFLALCAAYLLVRLLDLARAGWRGRGSLAPALTLAGRIVAPVAVVTVVGYTIFWAAAFTTIYTRPVTRIAASRWIFDNIPKGAIFGNEHWDDPVPMRIDGKDPFGGLYSGIELQWYGEDTPEKRQQAVQWLDKVEYINLTSNRLYLSIPRLPLRYPMTTKFYEALFDGSLGFEPIATFTSRPQLFGIEINDDDAEESFTVYDHPKVIIFKKTPAYSRAKVEALFASVDLATIIRQKPLDYTLSRGAYQMTPDHAAANTSGGTWAALFDPTDLANRLPLAAWLALLEVLGLAAFPVVFVIFRRFADRGYPLAKALGALALAWGAWTLASYRVLPFSRVSIVLALLALLALAALIALRQRRELLAFVRAHWRLLLVQELLFFGFFAISLLIRYSNPDLWHPAFGGEKPMDFAYLNAIIKTTWFPAYNPWFEGGYINYYYFGQVISATLVKLSGIVPEVAYNLLLPMFFAFTALGAFTVAFNVVAAGDRGRSNPREVGLRRLAELVEPTQVGLAEVAAVSTAGNPLATYRRPLIAGLLAAGFVTILGNLGEVRVLANVLVKMGQGQGRDDLAALIAGAAAWLVQGKPFPTALGDWFWIATRVIPDTINEFPFFTFLYADLHAHLMGLAFTAAALAFAFHAVLLRGALRWYDLGAAALVLGALRPINTWDYPTYLAAVGAALVIGFFAEQRTAQALDWPGRIGAYLWFGVVVFSQLALLVIPSNAAGVKVTLDAAIVGLVLVFAVFYGWLRTGAAFDPRPLARAVGWPMLALTGLSVLFYFPFLAAYGTAYSSVELWKGGRTTPDGFLIVHGVFLFIAATFLIVENLRRRDIEVWRALASGAPLAALLVIGLAALKLPAVALVAPLALLAAWLLLRRDTPSERRFVALLLLAALLLTAVVEVITLKGDIGRMNTVFKFYLQAWVLFGVAGGAGLVLSADQLLPLRRSRGIQAEAQIELSVEAGASPAPASAPIMPAWQSVARQVWWAALGLLLIAGLLYPGFATWAKIKDRYVAGSPAGLNGMNYMLGATYGENGQVLQLAPDHAAIQWLRENVEGSPVIAEANTGLYRWGNRISINTGLPTPIGWDWHTKQQYSLIEGGVIDRRLEDVKMLYNTPDANQTLTLLARYDISYVYVGPLERAVYNAQGLGKFATMAAAGKLEKVYDAEKVQIYRVP
jgi:YYY domain-containing protein